MGVINQSFSFVGNLPQLIEVIAVIPATIVFGRAFCGWMCAFGTLGDMLYLISNRFFKIKFKMNEKLDRVLKYFKFVLLAFLIAVVWTFDITIFTGANPWNAFGVLATFGKFPDVSYALTEFTIGTLILVAIIIASFFVERFFCRYLCPLGAVFSIVSKLKFVKISKLSQKCGSCRICTNSCAMGIQLYKHDKIDSGECIHCYKCVSACPRNNVAINIGKEDMRTGVAAALAVTCMTGLYYAGTIACNASGTVNTITSTKSTSKSSESQIYADGTYEGSGTGFRGAVTNVSVTIENDIIKDIKVVSYGDDAPYFNRAYNSIANQILSSQSTEVDAVSGATYSSVGIMDAVADALEKAKITPVIASSDVEEKVTEVPTPTSAALESTPVSADFEPTQANNSNELSKSDNNANNENSENEAKSTENSKSIYKDGMYEGSARGFKRGITTVSVVIKNDKITDIEVVSHGDDRPFFNSAYAVIDEMLQTQSTDVDVVSGATYSSMGIMNAVEDALEQARTQ